MYYHNDYRKYFEFRGSKSVRLIGPRIYVVSIHRRTSETPKSSRRARIEENNNIVYSSKTSGNKMKCQRFTIVDSKIV